MTQNEVLCILYGFIVGLTGRVWLMKTLFAKILGWFQGDVMRKIISCIPVIVVAVEKAMADGKITPDERKQIAMAAVNAVAEKFNIKISGLMSWVISVIIDNIAKKLPSKDGDIKVPDIILSITKEF
jgi:hypothetical protein